MPLSPFFKSYLGEDTGFVVSCSLGSQPNCGWLLDPEEPLGILAKNRGLFGKRHIGTLTGFMDHLLCRHEIDFMRVVGGIGKTAGTDLLYDVGENPFVALAADENLTARQIIVERSLFPRRRRIDTLVA